MTFSGWKYFEDKYVHMSSSLEHRNTPNISGEFFLANSEPPKYPFLSGNSDKKVINLVSEQFWRLQEMSMLTKM